MKTSPKISIVIPSFNKVKYIKLTLDSIFNQKYSNLEVVVQDGGSTDGSLEIIRKYKIKYPKIIKLESENDGGQLEAIKKGFSKASGDILAYINADDCYKSGSFDTVAKSYINNPQALWFAGYGEMIDESGMDVAGFWTFLKKTLLDLNSYLLLLLTSNYLMQPSVFLSKKAYKKYGPFVGVGRYIFEYEMWLKIGRVSMPTIIRSTLSKFRVGKTNMSSVYYDQLFKKDLEVTQRYSGNSVIVLLHKLNNFMRLLSIKYINK